MQRQPETIQFKKLHPDAIIPTRGTENSAGFDLYALNDMLITGGCGNVLVPTGIAVQLPEGTYGRIAMRSGMATKQHLSVSAGVIDIDYTGGVGVVVYCTKSRVASIREYADGTTAPSDYSETFRCYIRKGERFAQLIPELVSSAKGEEVTEFRRKYGEHVGFGSTGTK
jgi:deoxyuridine 5'-triphosphate nucleotidohydrolase